MIKFNSGLTKLVETNCMLFGNKFKFESKHMFQVIKHRLIRTLSKLDHIIEYPLCMSINKHVMN
jgi:hypothetical protein